MVFGSQSASALFCHAGAPAPPPPATAHTLTVTRRSPSLSRLDRAIPGTTGPVRHELSMVASLEYYCALEPGICSDIGCFILQRRTHTRPWGTSN